MKTVAGCLITLGWIPINMTVGAFIHAWAVTKLWTWYVAGVFGVHQLTIPEAYGLCLLLNLFLLGLYFKGVGETKTDKDDGLTSALRAVFVSLLSWAMMGASVSLGWAVKSMFM